MAGSGSIRRRSRLTSVSTLRTVTNVSPRQIFAEQRLAAEDDAGVRGQQVQQAELLVGQLDVAPVDPHAARRHVDLDAVDAHRRLAGRVRARPAAPTPGAAGAAARGRAPPARARRTAWSGSRRPRSRGRPPCRSPRGARSASGSARRGSGGRSAPPGTATGRRARAPSRRAPSGRSARPRPARAPRCRRLGVAAVALVPQVQAHQLADVRLVLDDQHARRSQLP